MIIIKSLVTQQVKNPLQCGRPGFDPWVGKILWRRERLPTPVFWPGECFFQGFPDSSVGKESPCNAGDPSLIPGSGRSTGEGISYPLQYSWASLGCNARDLGLIPGLGRSLGEGKCYFWLFRILGYKQSYTTEQLSLHFFSL